MKKVSFKKAGISMVALVITIIVLIVLTSAVVINGIGAPKQAQLAVFYSNIDTVQDLVSLEMGNNMIEGALRGYDDDYKWTGIVEGYGWDEENGELLEPENGFSKTSEGIGENIEPIMSDLLDKTTLAEGEKSKYYVGESGKVYYKGFEYEEKTYYNKDKKVEGIDRQIVIVEPVVITAADIVASLESPMEYYGAKVNYTAGGQNDWRIFYSDGTNIYITTRRPVVVGVTLQNYYGKNSRNLLVEALQTNDGTYVNSMYADSEKTSDGITYEMLRASYNQVRRTNQAHNLSVNANGAVTWTSNSISRLEGTPQEDLYIWAYDSSLENGYNFYWLASPEAVYSNSVMIGCSDNSSVSCTQYFNNHGIRPLVCLKSNIQLIESGVLDANGYMTYNISTVTP